MRTETTGTCLFISPPEYNAREAFRRCALRIHDRRHFCRERVEKISDSPSSPRVLQDTEGRAGQRRRFAISTVQTGSPGRILGTPECLFHSSGRRPPRNHRTKWSRQIHASEDYVTGYG